MRILFITANRLGDAVISTGVLAALQRRYPSATFTIVCGPVTAGLFQPDPRCERVIVLEKQRYDRHWLSLWRQCVPKRWFMIVDLRGSPVGLGLWARRRVVVPGGRKPGLRILQQARALGFRQMPRPCVWTTPAQDKTARQLLGERRRWLALAPTANWTGKMWPAERFAALSEKLSFHGFVPALFYGPGPTERERAEPLLSALPGALDLGGDRPIGEVAALLKRCALFVGNDSGLMHLAAAAGTPTLGLFGPSHASQYAPSGVCASFVTAPGKEGEAPMDQLSVDRVLNAVFVLLKNCEEKTEKTSCIMI